MIHQAPSDHKRRKRLKRALFLIPGPDRLGKRDQCNGPLIIAGTYNEKTMAMGKQNSNNRAAVSSTLDGDVLTPGAATKVFTLVDAGEGLFAIQASNGKYLNAAGTGSSNYLREADDFEAASAKWTITFDENGANIVATSTGNRNVIRYNSTNNSELFSCYAEGGQRAINIYSTTSAP
jgi:hypothetical protein